MHRHPCHSTNDPIYIPNNARQVRSRDHQAEVMIEGVQVRNQSTKHRHTLKPTIFSHYMSVTPQNHTPELMIIDEIGRPKECLAALTCKERGVAMIGSAHGSFFSLLRNKDLRGIMGGISVSIVGDAKAKSDNHGSKVSQSSACDCLSTPSHTSVSLTLHINHLRPSSSARMAPSLTLSSSSGGAAPTSSPSTAMWAPPSMPSTRRSPSRRSAASATPTAPA